MNEHRAAFSVATLLPVEQLEAVRQALAAELEQADGGTLEGLRRRLEAVHFFKPVKAMPILATELPKEWVEKVQGELAMPLVDRNAWRAMAEELKDVLGKHQLPPEDVLEAFLLAWAQQERPRVIQRVLADYIRTG